MERRLTWLEDERTPVVLPYGKLYRFQVGGIGHVVIRICRRKRDVGNYEYEFEQSHFIHTPLQFGLYATSHPYARDEGSALRMAKSTITGDYSSAVAAGHKPSEGWLIKNEHFLKCD